MHHLSRATTNLCSLNLCDLISGKKCDLWIILIQNLKFHVYLDIWKPVVGQQLYLENEDTNRYDPYAVAVKGHCKGTLPGVQIIGDVPIEISSYLFFAIKHGCSFEVRVSEQTPILSDLDHL